MEVEISKQLHRHAVPLAFGLIGIIAISILAITNLQTTSTFSSALTKKTAQIKPASNKFGILKIQPAETEKNDNLSEVGRAADYYFKFN